jgi:thioredoxin 1
MDGALRDTPHAAGRGQHGVLESRTGLRWNATTKRGAERHEYGNRIARRDAVADCSRAASGPCLQSPGSSPTLCGHPPAAGPSMSENITHVKDADFETEVLKSDTPVLLDFWAEWCGPCKSIAPMLDDIAKDYSGRLKVVKINIDENQKTPMTYGVRGIPTLMVFKGGKVEATQIGAVGKGQLTQMIDKAIAGAGVAAQ